VSFIDTHRDRFGVEPICRTLGIAPSTYYARKTRPPSRRAIQNARLIERIRCVHEANDGAHGSRRVWKALRRQASRGAVASSGCCARTGCSARGPAGGGAG
jgi:putative transposase